MINAKEFLIIHGLAILAFSVTGCHTMARVNVGNGTAYKIKVTSSQTKQEIEVAPGQFKIIPHATGDIIVATQFNENLRYCCIEPPSIDLIAPNYLDKKGRLFGPGRITFKVRIEKNMILYAILPSDKIVNAKNVQPVGYPKVGQPVGD